MMPRDRKGWIERTRHVARAPYLHLAALLCVLAAGPRAVATAQTVISVGAYFDNNQVYGAVEEEAGDGVCSLREAIQNANVDADLSGGDCPAGSGADVIELNEYTNYVVYDAPYEADGPNGLPSITSEMTILSRLDPEVSLGTQTAIARAPHASAFRIFHIAPGGRLKLVDLTLKNGWSSGSLTTDEGQGGAVYVAPNGTVEVVGGLITENRSDNAGFQDNSGNGGGIYVSAGGSAHLIGSTLSLNTSDNSGIAGDGGSGGGIYVGPRASLTLQGSTIKYNVSRGRGRALSSGGSGAGVYADSGAVVTIEDSDIVDNAVYGGDLFGPTASGFGGGLYLGPAASLTMAAASISRNVTDSGGDACFGDVEGGHGGGLYASSGAILTIQDSHIEANRTGNGVEQEEKCPGSDGGSGGGLFADSGVTITLSNTVLSGNATGNGSPERGPELGAGSGGHGGGLFAGTGTTLHVIRGYLRHNKTGRGADGSFDGSGGDGGGLFVAGGTVLIEDGTAIESNETGNGLAGVGGSGGGLFMGPESNLTLTDCLVRGNRTGTGGTDLGGGQPGGSGGGLFAAGEAVVTRCTITENQTGSGGVDAFSSQSASGDGGSGGGLAGTQLTLVASTVSYNRTGAGGDAYSANPEAAAGSGGSGGGVAATSLTLISSTVSGNVTGGAGAFGPSHTAGAGGRGGGLSANVLESVSSTIAANASAGAGGGAAIINSGSLLNTILAGNTAAEAADCLAPSDSLTSLGHNLFGEGTGCPATPTDVTADSATVFFAVLLPLSDNGGPMATHALPPTSPAVDAGTCEAGADQRGEMRPAGMACDIGAFELQTAPPLTSLVAYWPFNEGTGTLATDGSGNGYDGVLGGDPVWMPGRFGSALAFDGQDDYVAVPDAPGLDLTDAVTIAAWFNPSAHGGDNATGVEKHRAYRLLVNKEPEAARWFFDTWDAQDNFHRVISKSTVPYDTWHHVAATYDGASMRLYIDGQLDTTLSMTGPLREVGGAFAIGRRDLNRYYAGQIDEVALFNKALNADELLSLMAGTATKSLESTGTDEAAELPASFALEGNYPNPFNPSTTITFSLVQNGSVRLEVFDLLGRRVATLYEGTLAPGRHEVHWDGRGDAGAVLAGGTYLYRLQAGSFTASKTMVLLK